MSGAEGPETGAGPIDDGRRAPEIPIRGGAVALRPFRPVPYRTCLRALEQFNALGVQFISLTETVDYRARRWARWCSPFSARSRELERNLIRERVVAGMKVARKNGKHCGRPRCIVEGARVRKMRKDGAERGKRLAAALGVPRSVCQRAVSQFRPAR